MKKLILFGLAFTLALGAAYAQVRQEISVEEFENVDLDGNIRLYLQSSSKAEVVIEAKKEAHIADYDIEFRNGTLSIKHAGDRFGSTPKIDVYVTHPGLYKVDVDGLVHVYTNDPVESKRFKLKGDGMIRGEIEVNVDELEIALDGMCKLSVAGEAEFSDLSLDGMGKIDARGLSTSKYNQQSYGLASIKVGN